MQYHCLHIKTDFAEQWQKDIFDQRLGELGIDTIDGDKYYLPSEEWRKKYAEIEAFCASEEKVELLDMLPCPDENWNAAWEAEHPIQELPLGIKIIPHCAFGAGHHETTSMMIDALLSSDLSDKNVLDHGTGTGVLAIYAKHLGAKNVIAVDIDDKSVENARENAALNGENITVILGNTVPDGQYNLIMANIHRNILLANMEAYAKCLIDNGELWLSGFYESDIQPLVLAAEANHLRYTSTTASGEWRMLRFRK